jgi:1-acyl-sn-glycerol-3-phosphate acyltransferase
MALASSSSNLLLCFPSPVSLLHCKFDMALDVLRAVFWTDPLIVLATILMGSVSVACSFFDPDGSRQHAVSRAWARMLLAISGVKIRARGFENIQPGRNYLFFGNHLSLMDTPVILSQLPEKFLFLVNIRFVKMPFLGTHLRRAGHFTIDSSDTRSSLRTLNEAAKRIKDKNLSVLVFPEGSRSATGELAEFKEGAALIALKSGVPVLPFILRGTREVLPVGGAIVRTGVVDLVLGEPISPEGFTTKDREHFSMLMRSRLLEMQQQLDGALVETAGQ